MQIYELNETIALVVSTGLGTGAYLSFLTIKKKKKINVRFAILTFILNLFVANLGSEAMKIFGWDGYRSFALPLIAYTGQYLLEYIDEKRDKLLDASVEKIGFKIEKDEEYNQVQDDFQDGDTGTDTYND